jgi:hypothetical protein
LVEFIQYYCDSTVLIQPLPDFAQQFINGFAFPRRRITQLDQQFG